jgi:hypothetical protein
MNMTKYPCILLIILINVLPHFINAQSFTEKHLYPGIGVSIVETDDHNLIVVSNYGSKIHVNKIDTSGVTIWSNDFGDTLGTHTDNEAYSITKAGSGRYLIVGTYDPYSWTGGYSRVYCILINSAGNSIWERYYSINNSQGTTAVYDSISHVFYIVGSLRLTNVEIYLAKTDTNGTLLWEKSFGANQSINKIVMRNENNFWMVGGRTAGAYDDGFIANMDSSGNLNWSTNYGGAASDAFSDIILMKNGAIILGNTVSSGSGGSDAWILRTDEIGDTVWTKTIGSASADFLYEMKFDGDSNIWSVGYSNTTTPDIEQAWVFKMDTLGNVMYSKLLGGLNSEGLGSICYTNDNSLYAVGQYATIYWDSVYFVRIDSANLFNGIVETEKAALLQAYPNPANDDVHITIPEFNNDRSEIFLADVFGRKFIPDFKITSDGIIVTLPENSGLYVITVSFNGRKYYSKLIHN